MAMNKFFYFIMIVLTVLLSSCGRGTVYHAYQPVDAHGWKQGDTLFFPLPSYIPEGDYQVEIGLRHHEDYPYRDLWLAYGLSAPKDSVQLTLAYESGNWHGHGVAGLYQFTGLSPHVLHLPAERKDSLLRVVHIMSDKELKGICDVGIRLFKP
jgi:gliding motility-associated lipoprotein GldH